MDVVVGVTIARTATAEHLAQKGEIIVDEATANILGQDLTIQEWSEEQETHERFAVIAELSQSIDPPALMELGATDLAPEVLHPWLHPALVEREGSGPGLLPTEFRPCVALFVRFLGIDYDADEASTQLDQFIRQTQAIVARHGGHSCKLRLVTRAVMPISISACWRCTKMMHAVQSPQPWNCESLLSL